jgi:hypothetical protein
MDSWRNNTKAMANPKEARARIKINKLLEESEWRFFDDEKGIANIQLEPGVKLTKTKRAGNGPYTHYIPSYIRDYVGNLKEFNKV